MLYISHRLAEVRRVADRVTVLRNGEAVGTVETRALSDDDIVAMMLGRRLNRLFPERKPTARERVALQVRDLRVGHQLAGVSFHLKEGEVLGVAGLQGHGQRELFMALYGMARSTGEIEIGGKRTTIRSPRHALSREVGIALLPEDRRSQGLLLDKPIRENITLASLQRIVRHGFLNLRREAEMAASAAAQLQIKAQSTEQPAGALSGGNQQKVVLAKLLATEAKILLFYDPTRGIDVGTKAEIFALMRDLAANGAAILFYSTDLAELCGVADRCLVLSYGEARGRPGGRRDHGGPHSGAHPGGKGGGLNWSRALAAGWGVPLLTLIVLVGAIQALRPDPLSIDTLGVKVAATLTLILVATGQTIVIVRGGIDLSVGGTLSLASAIAATRADGSGLDLLPWVIVILVVGAAVGVVNGLLISGLRLQPFLITLATWSIVEGVALIVQPSEGGKAPAVWFAWGYSTIAGVPISIVLLGSPLSLVGMVSAAPGSSTRSAPPGATSAAPSSTVSRSPGPMWRPMGSPASSPRSRASSTRRRPAPDRRRSARNMCCRRSPPW